MSEYKSKATISSSESDSDGDNQPKKRMRKEKAEKSKKSTPKAKKGDGPEDHMYPLSRQRFVSVREFRGKVLIDIREHYTDNSGELKPGKKGISLTVEQWEKLKDSIDDISESVQDLS